MKEHSRNELNQYVLQLEQKYPVEKWHINGIDLWPIVRVYLSMFLFQVAESEVIAPISIANETQKKKTKNHFKLLVSDVKSIVKYYLELRKIKRRKFLFSSANTNNAQVENKIHNKFYSPLIEKYNIEKESYYFEFDGNINPNHQLSSLSLNYADLFGLFKIVYKYFYKSQLKKINVDIERYDEFLAEINQKSQNSTFSELYANPEILKYLIHIECCFINDLMVRIKPQKVFSLCFYLNTSSFILGYFANKLKIDYIEIQHGPQTTIHNAYNNWICKNNKMYNCMPNVYWCWDNESAKVINYWAVNFKNIKVNVIGNPWIAYWKNSDAKLDTHEKFILYSLQPSPVSMEELFHRNLIETIKSSEYKWFLRLHPRQTNEKDSIESKLKKEGVINYEINKATALPLPLLLSSCILHVTNFSGSAIEAAMQGKHTVLLHINGKLSFEGLISKNQATYIPSNDPRFKELFLTKQKQIEIEGNTQENYQYEDISYNFK